MEKVLEDFQNAVLAGNVEAALLTINTARYQHAPIDIYDEVLVPTQREVGTLWHQGELSIADEHLASQITSAAMNCLRETPFVCLPLGSTVVVSTLHEEKHELGARAFSDCLQFDGWSVHYLGVNTPAEELYRYALENNVELLAISITMKEAKERFEKLYTLVTSSTKGPALLVGGPGIAHFGEDFEPHPRFAMATSLRDGLSKARSLIGLGNPEQNLERTLVILGKGLRILRKQKGLSQQELSSQSGVDRTYLSMLESGKQNPSISILSKVASVLDISVPELLCSYLLLPELSEDVGGSHALTNAKRRITY